MPIYLSLPGHESKEPWRHGLSVYERPVPLEYADTNHPGNETAGSNDNNNSSSQQQNDNANNNVQQSHRPQMMRHDTSSHSSLMDEQSAPSAAHQPNNNNNNSANNNKAATPIRRIRHGEVVLVDQCVIAHGRYWLRLKWPGEDTGHGGYVALSKLDEDDDNNNDSNAGGNNNTTNHETKLQVMGSTASTIRSTSFLSPETNVCFPTSDSMKLLPMYDDGLNRRNNNNSNNNGRGGDGGEIIIPLDSSGDPVFCRICREGLHDVNSDYLETTTPSSSSQQQSSSSRGMDNNVGGEEIDEGSRERDVGATSVAATTTTTTTSSRNDTEEGSNNDTEERSSFSSSSNTNNNNSIITPPITRTHPSIDNPLLAPCKCTGSMAFVHYLCVEQWRNRSRHPGAKQGLNCETCGAEYTLPPPPSRPTTNRMGMEGVVVGDDDWLDAMPPHVLAALRRPHLWWQIGAAVVRRRWLRPIVPILISPLVALYCKARRTLKKRGVSRRRWACSLCRRRARWKCVRCLRSYYCSRQCQNVSWHIVHKHVCYKPARFWSSVVVYGLGILVFVPGIIKNFPIYDTSITLLPINFIAMGNIAGGFASTLKRSGGIDIRGRVLEIFVILCTLFLTAVTTGIVRGFFGDSSQCWGVFASSAFMESRGQTPLFAGGNNSKLVAAVFQYAQFYYQKWDFLCARAGFISRNFLCTPTDDGNTDYATIGCSSPVRSINPQFYLEEENCRADIEMMSTLWAMACTFLILENAYKEYRVRRRAAVHRGRRRPHQD